MKSSSSTQKQHLNGGAQQYISSITANDIILGRGLASVKHPGNVYFRTVIEQKRKQYASSCRRKIKKDISNEIWSIFCAQSCRFVMEVKEDNNDNNNTSTSDATDDSFESQPAKRWMVVAKQKVLTKIKQALRECDHRLGYGSPKVAVKKNQNNALTASSTEPVITPNGENLESSPNNQSDSTELTINSADCLVEASSMKRKPIPDPSKRNIESNDCPCNARTVMGTDDRYDYQQSQSLNNLEATYNNYHVWSTSIGGLLDRNTIVPTGANPTNLMLNQQSDDRAPDQTETGHDGRTIPLVWTPSTDGISNHNNTSEVDLYYYHQLLQRLQNSGIISQNLTTQLPRFVVPTTSPMNNIQPNTLVYTNAPTVLCMFTPSNVTNVSDEVLASRIQQDLSVPTATSNFVDELARLLQNNYNSLLDPRNYNQHPSGN